MKRALPFLLLLACNNPQPTDTRGIGTSDLSLQVLVETDDVISRVTVGLYARGHAYSRLDLQPGERLIARISGSAPIAFARAEGSLASYVAELAITEGTFEIELDRSGQSVRGTMVELPAPFALREPETAMEMTRAFTLAWGPASNDPVKLSMTARCLVVAERTLLRDPGAFTWSAADFGAGAEPPPCTGTIRVRRSGGSIRVAPGLAGVQLFRAEQVRAVGVWATR